MPAITPTQFKFPQSLLRFCLRWGLLCGLFALAGCGVGNDHETLNLGSVSVGDQLIDLQKARDAGAISDAEFETAKGNLLELLNATDIEIEIEKDDDDRDEAKDEQEDAAGRRVRENEAEDDDDGFIF